MAITIRPYAGSVTQPGVQFERVRPGDTGAAMVATGLDIAAQVTDRMAEEQGQREASNALLQATADFEAFKDGLRKRQDYGSFQGEWQTFAEQWKANNLQGLSSRGRQKLGQRVDELVLQGTNQVRDLSWATQVDVSRADLSRFLDDSFKLVGKDPTGAVGLQAMQGISERIDAALDAGFINAEQAENLRQDTKGRYGVIGATSLIEKDPYEARKQLQGGAFDAYLQPEKKLQLIGAADAEIKRREAEARARQAEARAAYLDGFEDELAFVADGNAVPNSAYTRENLVKVLGEEKGTKLADAYERAAATGQAAVAISTMSNDEVNQLLSQSVADLQSGPEDYKAKEASHRALLDAAKARKAALEADPANYVAQHFSAVQESFAAYAESGDVEDLQAATSLTLKLQAEMGVPADQRRPLTKTAAGALAKQILDAGSADKQIEALSGVLQLGDDATVRMVLQQLTEEGAPGALAYAAQNLQNGDTAAASRLLQGIVGEAPKMPTGSDADAFKGSVADAYADRQENLLLQGAWSGDPSRVLRAQDEAALVGRLAATSGNFALAASDVAAGLQPVTDDSLAAVTAPAGVDADALLTGFDVLRTQLVTGDAFAAAIGPAGNSVAQKIGEDVAEETRGEARWVDYGDGYALTLAPGTGAYLAGPDGKVRVFTLDDVIGAGTAGQSAVFKQFGQGLQQ